ncbi:hypothetical protein FY136_28795 (plasmid) [Agrobacterium tumefaciens]|uniref:hypothetical protein n=1 Tax=Agrobacterium tumefaciens TaxID=358 RepID=UPI0021D24ABE|nr:hypothetical protein [Agrobacterium tumefaciens]UXT53262.1 hypothetical protein FY136_28795 [Agrobacterium tumefaciens]
MGSIRERATVWVIKTALEKNAPTLIPTSGERAEKNDSYAVYLIDQAGVARLVVNDITEVEVTGKWSLDGKEFTEPHSIPLTDLPQYSLYIQHYFRGWAFYTQGIWQFVRNRLTRYPHWKVTIDDILQARFNRKELTRRDRMKVLAHILASTIERRSYETAETDLLTRFYTARWVHRPDKEELMTYYRLLLESLKASGDLSDGRHGFKLNAQALNTIADFEQEDRRHRDNYRTQRGIFWLTIVLMFVGVVQAGAAAYDAWWPKAEAVKAPTQTLSKDGP